LYCYLDLAKINYFINIEFKFLKNNIKFLKKIDLFMSKLFKLNILMIIDDE